MNKHTLRIIHICDIHMEADYSHSVVDNSTLSSNKPDQPHGNVAISKIVSMYDEPSILMVLKDV